jgi:hypothetical protein
MISQLFEPVRCFRDIQGDLVIASRPSVSCGDKVWKSKLPTIVVLAIIYLGVLPSIFIFYLHIYSKSANHSLLLSRLGSIVKPYKHKFSYWEAVVILKKILLTVVPSLISTNSSTKILLTLIVLIIFMLVEQLCKPFQEDIKNSSQLM